MEAGQRTIIVSNRLPITSSVTAKGITLHRSSGGLVAGLEGVHGSGNSQWVGCLGEASGHGRTRLEADGERQLEEQGLKVVDIPPALYKSYYEGFSNGAIWPLFHYMPDRCHFSADTWAAYREVNERFADAIVGELNDGDRVWVHDYQLMLLPGLLRQAKRDLGIGFFLHVPFPSAEIFRVMPWRRELIEGMLGADLIGFHTLEYMRHFSNAAARVLGVEPQMDSLPHGRRTIRLGAFPLGIDVAQMHAQARSEETEAELAKLMQSYAGRTVILGVDRLDYTKGVPGRLAAFAQALERNPDWVGRVSLVQVSVPSRVKVEEYQEIKAEVDELVGSINGRFGTAGYVPIHYVFRNLDRPHLLALYRRADVAMVTPIRDGLNLVCKEYVAAKGEEPGALVLSEFAGSAAEMGEAVLVNPWSRDSLVEGLERAVGMSDEDKTKMMASLFERLSRYDNRAWSTNFMAMLGDARHENRRGGRDTAGQGPDPGELADKAKRARQVFLYLDYDGTLVPVVDKPELAIPTAEIITLLHDMAAIPNFQVCVISGRDRGFLEEYLPAEITVVAEHGASYRPAAADSFAPLVDAAAFGELRASILTLMSDFERRIPGSRIEQKDFGMVWHYRMADPIFGYQQALVLVDTLGALLQRTPLGVLTSKKAVEVRHMGANKGDAVRALLEEGGFDPASDLIMTMGDDRTDEDMFRVYPAQNISISVGDSPVVASHVMEQPELIRLLENLARSSAGWQYRLWDS